MYKRRKSLTGRLARRPENLYYSVGAQWGYYSLGASGKGVALEGLIQDTFLKNFVEKPGQPGEGPRLSRIRRPSRYNCYNTLVCRNSLLGHPCGKSIGLAIYSLRPGCFLGWPGPGEFVLFCGGAVGLLFFGGLRQRGSLGRTDSGHFQQRGKG